MSEETNMKLVELVGQNPILYNWKDPNYSRKDKIDPVWEKIGKEMNEPVQSCRERWKNLRTAYVRNLKKRNLSSGSEAPKGKSYYLDNVMQFLIPFLKMNRKQDGRLGISPRRKESMVRNDSSDTEAPLSEEESTEKYGEYVPPVEEFAFKEIKVESLDEYDVEPETTTISKPESPSKKRSRETDALADGDEESTNFPSCSKCSKMEDAADAEFLRSLLPDVLAMNSKQKRKFKIGVLQLIDSLLEESPTTT